MTDVSKQVKHALVDVRTIRLNAIIDKARKNGGKVKVVLTGYLTEDFGRYDGTSTEHVMDVANCEMTIDGVVR